MLHVRWAAAALLAAGTVVVEEDEDLPGLLLISCRGMREGEGEWRMTNIMGGGRLCLAHCHIWRIVFLP
jgi:hypothetical protein